MPETTATTEPAAATTATTTANAATAAAAEPSAPTGDKPLGENGEKALKAERDARAVSDKKASDLQKQLDAINQANESAVEKAQRELKEAKDAATTAQADALRFRIAAKYQISDEDAELLLHGTDEATLERQAARVAAQNGDRPAGPRPDLSQGSRGGPGTLSEPRDIFAQLMKDN